jgi:inosine-uridine nucleoside N-ribohydrolase
MTRPQRVIIDCDPGIGPHLDADDGLAILFSLSSPELSVEAVTTVFGNVTVDRGAQNAVRILAAAGRADIPVAKGMDRPLSGRLQAENIVDYRKQDDSLPAVDPALPGVSDTHAVDLIIETVRATPGEIAILAVGPLTNVAMAILKEPRMTEWVSQIVIMGGAFGREARYGRGNVTPVAELNIWNDPQAAAIVFDSGIPVTAAGLDVTNPNAGTVLYEQQLQGLLELEDNRLSQFLSEMCRTYIEAPRFTWAENGCVLYDAVAAAALARPELGTTERGFVRVGEVGTVAEGQTVFYPDADGNVAILTAFQGERFVGEFISRIGALIQLQSKH